MSRAPATTFSFRPLPVARAAAWAAYALALVVAPLVFTSGLAQTLLCQMGIGIIACLAYNVLLGQGGMLSFGHAVYSGLGAFLAIHALNAVGAGTLHLPVSLVPMVGAFAGLACAALLGWVTTAKSGTTFAMITLGVGELVWSLSLMLPELFGGEGGISSNRVVGPPVMGITFGPQREVFWLIAAYAFATTALLYAFTRTPLGRLLNAVRDNPERVEYIGYSTRHVRYLAFLVSGFFMGLSGGLAAINFEIVTAEVTHAHRSGALLLFTYLGGAGHFAGPIVGAVLMVLATVVLSEWTKAWLLYLGLAFLFMVMQAPGGIASLVAANARVFAAGQGRGLGAGYLALAGAGLVALGGAGTMVEMLYHLQLNEALGPLMPLGPAVLDAKGVDAWVGAGLAALTGAFVFELARRQVRARWDDAQSALAAAARRREGAA